MRYKEHRGLYLADVTIDEVINALFKAMHTLHLIASNENTMDDLTYSDVADTSLEYIAVKYGVTLAPDNKEEVSNEM